MHPSRLMADEEAEAMDAVGNSPEAFASFIKQDIAIWKEVADQAKVAVQ